jgi:hypothetical protein
MKGQQMSKQCECAAHSAAECCCGAWDEPNYKAMKLALALDDWATQLDMGREPDPKSLTRKAAAELRRLHSELERLKAPQPGQTSAERTLKSLGYTDNGGEYWKPPLGAWPPQPKQEPVAMREALKKLAQFLDVVRVYAQEIRPIHELETDKPLHWKAREIQDEVIRLINTIPQQEPIHWIAPNFEFLFSSTPQRSEQEPVIDKSAAIRIATALGWTPPEQPAPVQEPVAIPREWRTALRKLAFMARTSGGTVGHDSGLVAACEEAEALLSKPYTTPPAPQRSEQEPVAYLNPDDLCADTAFRWCKIDAFTKPVYLHSPQRTKVVFPTMLRKMWSGGEVQAWLDENVNKENT